MHEYLMGVRDYLGYYDKFIVKAESKDDAVAKGLIYVRHSWRYSTGNHNINDVKCFKKLNKNHSKKYNNIEVADV